MRVQNRAERLPFVLAAAFLLAFVAVDHLFVGIRVSAYRRAETRAAQLASQRVMTHAQSEWAKTLGQALGEEPAAAPGIDDLSEMVKSRGLTKVELGRLPNTDGTGGELFQIVVRGRAGNHIKLVRDLEASESPISIRDLRVVKLPETGELEMRVRLEVGKSSG